MSLATSTTNVTEMDQYVAIITGLYMKRGQAGYDAIDELTHWLLRPGSRAISDRVFPGWLSFFVDLLNKVTIQHVPTPALDAAYVHPNKETVLDMLPVHFRTRRKHMHAPPSLSADHSAGDVISLLRYISENIGSVDWAFYLTDSGDHGRARYHAAFSLSSPHTYRQVNKDFLNLELTLQSTRVPDIFEEIVLEMLGWEVFRDRQGSCKIYGHVVFQV
jgi:hypothetical protein